MKFPSNIKKLQESIVPSGFQVKKFLIVGITRTSFLIFSFLFYIILLDHVPIDIIYRYEISMIASIAVVVLVFLPIFDNLTHRLKIFFLSEYLTEDANVSRIAYKKFNLGSLIKAVFPDMVKISGSSSGKLGIFKEKGIIEIYNYNRGQKKKIQTHKGNPSMIKLIPFLLNKRKGVSIIETTDYPEINKDFVDLSADFLLPFLFREKIFGFLALSSIPDSDSIASLNLLSRQCALVIHNHNLSIQVVENLKYRQEEESAKRIQNSIQHSSPPLIEGLLVEYSLNNPDVMIEFFQLSDKSWKFLILNAGGNSLSAGLIHSYISGSLFSRITRGKAESFAEIKELLQRTFKKAKWVEKYNYIIGKVNHNLSLDILQKGTDLFLYSEIQPNENQISIGWKNTIKSDKYPIVIHFRGKEIMRFIKE